MLPQFWMAMVTKMRSLLRYCLATCIVAIIFLLAAAGAEAEHLPFKYLSGLDARWNAAELVCTATVSEMAASGNFPVIEGITLREYLVTAYVDRVFKGDWTEQRITFRFYGLKIANGIEQYIGPPIGDFQPNSRYLLFLRNEAAPEVVTPVFETAIRLAPVGEATEYEALIPQDVSADKTVLAAEMVAAIYVQPSQLMYGASYFGEIVGLLGRTDAARVFESFYRSTDPVVKVEAAKMVASPYSQDRGANERASRVLLAVAADLSAPDFTRADAILRLAEMRVIAARPYAESVALKTEDGSAREFALRALEHIGTRKSEAALVSSLDDPTMTNQFLAAYALQQIECGTSLDESLFRKHQDEIVAEWRSRANQSSSVPHCRPSERARQNVDSPRSTR